MLLCKIKKDHYFASKSSFPCILFCARTQWGILLNFDFKNKQETVMDPWEKYIQDKLKGWIESTMGK